MALKSIIISPGSQELSPPCGTTYTLSFTAAAYAITQTGSKSRLGPRRTECQIPVACNGNDTAVV